MAFLYGAQKAVAALISTALVAALLEFGVEGIEGEVETVIEAVVAALAVYVIPNRSA